MTKGKGRRGRKGFPGASPYTDRSGVKRWRYRRGSFSRDLGKDYASHDFIARYQAAVTESAAPAEIGASRTIPGSFDALIVRWYASPGFQLRAAGTRKAYRGVLERFRKICGKDLVADLGTHHVQAIINKMESTPETARKLLSLLNLILQFAVTSGMIDRNPATGVRAFSRSPYGFHSWTEEEIAQFATTHPPGTMAHRAMMLMLWTGAARVDAVKLGRQNIRGNFLEYRRQKTAKAVDVPICLPIAPDLRKALAMAPKDSLTFLHSGHGKSLTAEGLGKLMRTWCNAAGLPHCTAHGLRKALARRLAERGATPHQIMAVTGHGSLKEVDRYTRAATLKPLAVEAFALICGTDRKQKSGELTGKFAKKSPNTMKRKEE